MVGMNIPYLEEKLEQITNKHRTHKIQKKKTRLNWSISPCFRLKFYFSFREIGTNIESIQWKWKFYLNDNRKQQANKIGLIRKRTNQLCKLCLKRMRKKNNNRIIVTFTVAGVATIEWIFLRQSDIQQHTPIKASHLFRGTLPRNRPLWYCGHDWHRSCNRIYGFRPCVSGKRHPWAMCKSWLNPLTAK